MNLNDVTLDGEPLAVASDRDVDDAEATLGITFPDGYREYITTLGRGYLAPTTVNLYLPDVIEGMLTEWRAGIAEDWFWDDSTLTEVEGPECIIIGDTAGADELVVHPRDSETIYVFPHDDDKVHAIGKGVWNAIEWLQHSGVLGPAKHEALRFSPRTRKGLTR